MHIPRQHVRLLFAITIFATFSIPAAFGQEKEWRPMNPADLKSEKPVVEADADAEAIFWEVRIDNSDSSGFTRKHYVRVKIFTERGRERFSKFDIPFLRGLKIKDLAARVTRSDGTSVEIGKNDIFEREIVRASGLKVKAKSFAVPGIEPGVIVEYRYTEDYANGGAAGTKLEFQRDIPIRLLTYYYKPYNKKEPATRSYNFNDTKFVKDTDGYYIAQRRDVPAFKQEPRMPPEDMVRPWMQLQGIQTAFTSVSMMGFTYVQKDPSNPAKYWGGVGAENVFYVKAMMEAAKEVKKTAEEVTAGAANDDEKLRKIYEYCQKSIKNTSYDPSMTDEMRAKLPEFKSYKEMIKQGSGSYFRINMLFGAMAYAVGMQPRYMLAGNRSQMFFDPTMTDDDLVSFAGIGIQLGNNIYIHNPGIKYAPFRAVPWYWEDTYVLSIGADNFTWVQTPSTPPDRTNVKRSAKLMLADDGTLEGTVSIELTGHRSLNYRLEYYDESQDKRETAIKDEVKRRISQAEVSAVLIENVEDHTKPIVQRYAVKVPGYAQKTGKRLFIQPGFFEFGVAPIFSSADRKYDIFFSYGWSETDNIEIQFPSTYAIDNGDSPPTVEDSSRIGSNAINIRVDSANSKILYDRKFYFGGNGKVLFKSAYYTGLKTMWDAFNKSDTHQLSLKQK